MATADEYPALVRRVRDLAQTLAARHPGLWHYEFILDRVQHAELSPDTRSTFDALFPLGSLAVREFEPAEGEYADLRDALCSLVDAARVRAGVSLEEYRRGR